MIERTITIYEPEIKGQRSWAFTSKEDCLDYEKKQNECLDKWKALCESADVGYHGRWTKELKNKLKANGWNLVEDGLPTGKFGENKCVLVSKTIKPSAMWGMEIKDCYDGRVYQGNKSEFIAWRNYDLEICGRANSVAPNMGNIYWETPAEKCLSEASFVVYRDVVRTRSDNNVRN